MNARRRILISGVVLAQPMGGVRRHNVELLPRVAKLAAAEDVGLALLVGKDGLPFELSRDIERLACDVPARPALVRATLEGRALRRELARARENGAPFALVHTAHLPVPRGLEVPYTLTLHDLRNLEGAHTPLSRRLVAGKLVGAAVRGARTVLTVSESVRASLLERFRLAPERVAVVPNAADHFEPRPRATAASEHGARAPIVHVGHVEPRKNLELVVRALALDPSLPDLVAHGAAKGGEDVRLRELARELGVAERVHFRGAFDERELAELYAQAGAIVLPSRLEGFGIAAIEAQRALAPLAIARIPALLEVAGDATPSFAPDDAAECARALRAALESDGATLAAARERAARFTWDRSAEAWWRVWRAALGT
ncbi:MAG: glycosyltransferase family 4 protein [Planctomycetes bacterium]|nr:glycosyltransferase family 4 protein [Planctomycetota bacterium]